MRTRLFCVALAAMGGAGCGGDLPDATHNNSGGTATTRDGSGADAASQSRGSTAAPSEANARDAGANACTDMMALGPPITEAPSELGCFADVNGRWQGVPCLCDLWIDSPSTLELGAGFSLSFTPTSMAPSLDGDVEVNVVFPDADATWFGIWQTQSETDTGFSVTHSDDGRTTVRLGQSGVTLDPVPLAACESRHARATIHAPWGTALRLDMVATLVDPSGNPVTTVNGFCEQATGQVSVV